MVYFSPSRASSAFSLGNSGAKSVVISMSRRSWFEPVISGRAVGLHAGIANPISTTNLRIQISSFDASATANSSAL